MKQAVYQKQKRVKKVSPLIQQPAYTQYQPQRVKQVEIGNEVFKDEEFQNKKTLVPKIDMKQVHKSKAVKSQKGNPLYINNLHSPAIIHL